MGEFTHRDDDDSRYVMLVNCGLDRTAEIRIKQRGAPRMMTQVSPVDASSIPVKVGDPLWLTPGQGVLLKLGDVAPTTTSTKSPVR